MRGCIRACRRVCLHAHYFLSHSTNIFILVSHQSQGWVRIKQTCYLVNRFSSLLGLLPSVCKHTRHTCTGAGEDTAILHSNVLCNDSFWNWKRFSLKEFLIITIIIRKQLREIIIKKSSTGNVFTKPCVCMSLNIEYWTKIIIFFSWHVLTPHSLKRGFVAKG